MPADPQTFVVATDAVISALIRGATQRLVVMAPAVSEEVATASCEAMRRLGPAKVTVIVEGDPAVFRLGFGSLAALEAMHTAAAAHGVSIRTQPGLRLGLVVADDVTLVYSPTAELVESQPAAGAGLNAVCIGPLSEAATAAIENRSDTQQIGRTPLSPENLSTIQQDIDANPPQPFDLSRKIIAFHSFVEFVELEVLGTEVSRRMVTLPNHLLAVADRRTREQLRTTFRLVPPDHKLSGQSITRDRMVLTRHLLRTVPKYGTVVLRRDKPRLLAAVERLQQSVDTFAAKVRDGLERHIERSVAELSRALLPALVRRPPANWVPSDGIPPGRDEIQERLNRDLRDAFGSASELVSDMKVSCRFKGVTYELLNEPEFVRAVLKAVPELGNQLHTEFAAAPAIPQSGRGTSASSMDERPGNG